MYCAVRYHTSAGPVKYIDYTVDILNVPDGSGLSRTIMKAKILCPVNNDYHMFEQ